MDKIVNLSLARKSVPTLIDVVQGATAPNIVFVLEDYTPPSNARARLYIKKTNAEVYNDCVLSGNQVTYTPTAGSFDEAGQCVAQLEIVQGSTIAVSWRIFVTVEPNLIEGSAAPASTEYGALESLIINAQQYDTIIGANNIVGANNRQGWTALTSGQDLNAVTGVGMYFTHSNAAASSLANTPFDKAFVMKVGQVYSSNFITQEATTMGTSVVKEETKRRYTWNGGSTWSEWELQPTRSEVNTIANQGAKNLAKSDGATSTTLYGVTFTKNADGSVTANGTATANATFYIDSGYYSDLQGESLVLSGCPEGGSSTTYRIAAIRSGSAIAIDYGEGRLFTGRDNQRVGITIFTGYTADNVTFYPMLRHASVQDDTYVPYGMSNAELTEDAVLQSTTITATIGGVTSSWVVRKRYKTVEFTLTTGNVLANAQNGDVIMTLPEGYRPSTTVYIPIMMIKGSWETAVIKPCLLAIATNGTVTLRAATADIQASGSLFGTVSFITA